MDHTVTDLGHGSWHQITLGQVYVHQEGAFPWRGSDVAVVTACSCRMIFVRDATVVTGIT